MVAYDVETGDSWYLDSWNKRTSNSQRSQRVLSFMKSILGRRYGNSRVVQGCPEQYYGRGSGVDCGVFVCSWLLRYCLDEQNGPFTIYQRDMNEFRMHLAVSVVDNTLVL